jgi:hypothetical protein
MIIHILSLLVYAALFVFAFPHPADYAQFLIGLSLGFSLFFLDRVFDVFFIRPETEFSQIVRGEWKKRKFWSMVSTILQGKELQEKLITRSILFLIAYVAVAIFVLTSTGSILGIGLVLGIGFHFCMDFIRYRKDLEKFNSHFLWQVKRKFAKQEVVSLIISFCLFFALISLLVLK